MIAQGTNHIVWGDSYDVLAMVGLSDTRFNRQVGLTFTSPPYYNAREYSQFNSYREYLEHLREIFSLLWWATQDGRYCVVNTSPVIQARKHRQDESKRYPIPFDLNTIMVEIGWEFVDDIVWVKPEGASVNRIGGFEQHHKPLTYKPNPVTEYLMVYRKSRTADDKLVLVDKVLKGLGSETVNESLVTDGDYERSNVWYFSPSSHPLHPATFPSALSDRVLKLYSCVGDLVCDPFAGTGTVAQSAYTLGRNYLMIEKHRPYTDVIVDRMKFDSDVIFTDFSEYTNELQRELDENVED